MCTGGRADEETEAHFTPNCWPVDDYFHQVCQEQAKLNGKWQVCTNGEEEKTPTLALDQMEERKTKFNTPVARVASNENSFESIVERTKRFFSSFAIYSGFFISFTLSWHRVASGSIFFNSLFSVFCQSPFK